MVDTLQPEVQQGLRNAAFALFGGSTDPMALQKGGAFAIKNFKDSAAGRATEDVTEKVGAELQGMVDDGVIAFPSIFTFVGRAFASVDGLGRDLDPKYDFRALCEPYVGEIISERYQLEARQQRAALFDGVKATLEAPSRLAYVEEAMRALQAGEVTVRSRSVENERGVKTLEK